MLYYSQFVFGILIMASFSARLTSTLAVKETVAIIKTLEDVHNYEYNLYINGILRN